jgi:hypothetical protein
VQRVSFVTTAIPKLDAESTSGGCSHLQQVRVGVDERGVAVAVGAGVVDPDVHAAHGVTGERGQLLHALGRPHVAHCAHHPVGMRARQFLHLRVTEGQVGGVGE